MAPARQAAKVSRERVETDTAGKLGRRFSVSYHDVGARAHFRRCALQPECPGRPVGSLLPTSPRGVRWNSVQAMPPPARAVSSQAAPVKCISDARTRRPPNGMWVWQAIDAGVAGRPQKSMSGREACFSGSACRLPASGAGQQPHMINPRKTTEKSGRNRMGRHLLPEQVAEREGFEPSVRKAHNGFRDRPVQPLRHLSAGPLKRAADHTRACCL